MTSEVSHKLAQHLLREDRQEDLCFALWNPSEGKQRYTALLHTVVLPECGERNVHGNASFNSRYVERVILEARRQGMGVALLHSHLGPGWQSMSRDDIDAERRLSGPVFGATKLPFLGLTLATDYAWSARFWLKRSGSFTRHWCESVRVIGESGLIPTFANHLLPPPAFREELTRTTSAWGQHVQADLARLRIGLVGMGSVGAMQAEALARTGLSHLTLIDFDTVETVNLDRHLHAVREDVGRFKVDVVAARLRESATSGDFSVDAETSSLVEHNGLQTALDCDVVFCSVDRPWPRFVANFIAYAHLIPVVECGIKAHQKVDGRLRDATWKSRIVMPSRQCLACAGQYDPSHVSLEREGKLDDPEYIATFPAAHTLRANQNVFAFSASVASFTILQFLSLVIRPLGISDTGSYRFNFTNGKLDVREGEKCGQGCAFPGLTALGDRSDFEVTGRHLLAESRRNLATSSAGPAARQTVSSKIWDYFLSVLPQRLVHRQASNKRDH